MPRVLSIQSLVFLAASVASPAFVSARENAVSDAPLDDYGPIFVQHALAVVDLVLTRHVDPPSRQQLVLQVLRGLAREAGDSRPIGLGERVSSFSTPEEFRGVLLEFWSKARGKSTISNAELEERALAHMLSIVPGEARLAPAKEYSVEQQFAANQYVGTGIALSIENGHPTMNEVFEDGPAHQAGARRGDWIEQIDGVATNGKPLKEIVEMLRGAEGSQVTVALKQPDEDTLRPCTITRGEVVLKTVAHQRVGEEGRAPAGYLRISRVSASTPHELRRVEPMLQGIEGLIIDLRSLVGADLHQATLIADAWLDGGAIGRVRTRKEVKELSAAPECVFRNVQLLVLVDAATSGAAEWLAAALRDQRDATIAGWPTSGEAYVVEGLPVAESDQVLVLATGFLEGRSGAPLVRPADLPLIAPREAYVRRKGESTDSPIDPAFAWGVRPDELFEADGEPLSDEQIIQRSLEILERKIEAADAKSQ